MRVSGIIFDGPYAPRTGTRQHFADISSIKSFPWLRRGRCAHEMNCRTGVEKEEDTKPLENVWKSYYIKRKRKKSRPITLRHCCCNPLSDYTKRLVCDRIRKKYKERKNRVTYCSCKSVSSFIPSDVNQYIYANKTSVWTRDSFSRSTWLQFLNIKRRI